MRETFTKHVAITLGFRSLMFALSMGLSIVLARFLGTEGRGVYALAVLVPSLAVLLFSLGLGDAVVYFAAKKRYALQQILSSMAMLGLLLGLFGMVAGAGVVLLFQHSVFFGVPAAYLFLALLTIPLQLTVQFLAFILLGLQKVVKYNLVLVLKGVLFLAFALFTLGVLHLGVGGVIVSEILMFISLLVLLFLVLPKATGGAARSIRKGFVREAVSYGGKAYVGQVFTFLHYRADMFLLGFFGTPAMVGLYAVSVGIAEKLQTFSDAAATMFFSRVASEQNQEKLKEFTPFVFRTSILLSGLGAAILFVAAQWIIPLLYSESFAPSVRPFQILLIGAVALSGYLILESDFKGRGNPLLPTLVLGISIVINIVLNIFWIPSYGIEGAALATAVSYSTALALLSGAYARNRGQNVGALFTPRRRDFRFYGAMLVMLWHKLVGMLR